MDSLAFSRTKDCYVELAQAFGIGNYVDHADFAIRNREIKHEEQASTPGYDDAHHPVHECRSC